MDSVSNIITNQRAFFLKHLPFSLEVRLSALKRLKTMIKDHEKEILDALYRDLKKASVEALVTELLCVVNEINFAMKRLSSWILPEKTRTLFPLSWVGRSYRYPEPYGVVLIIVPWNYPLSLMLSPLIGSLAAGNCAIIKPSEIAPNTAALLNTLIPQYFDPSYVTVVTGDASVSNALIEAKPDYILFTGSTHVGKEIMKKAAEHLIPLTLELGGKCPVIVDETTDWRFAARRIAWAKTLNAGQTCVAPDFLYVHHAIKEKLIDALINELRGFYGKDIKASNDFGRIVTEQHCQRLVNLLNSGGQIRFGGDYSIEEKYIEPTLIDKVTFADPIMQEEIFGPLLPIMTFETIEDVISELQSAAKPLALYYFTRHRQREKKVLSELSFGGGCINDCIIQLSNWHLPFGGVGQSGMGSYHGKHSFDTFSHYKSIYRRSSYFDYPFLYPPYLVKRTKWLKWILGW